MSRLLSGYSVGNSYLLSEVVAMVMVVMGDMCVRTITAIIHLLLLFIVAMAMVVMGDTCVQSITAIHTITYVCIYTLCELM